MDHEDDWDDEYDDVEDDDAYYEDDDESSDTVACPRCGADVYEDAEQCPHCGDYITHSSGGYLWKGRPVWWIVLGLLGILAVVLTFTIL